MDIHETLRNIFLLLQLGPFSIDIPMLVRAFTDLTKDQEVEI